MKRKFISALLFGALLTASTSTFVSCKDYDDDITELRNDITSNATDLSSLVDEKMKNANAEIAALKTQAEALDAAYKSADAALQEAIKNASNDAQGYADIQAAEAQKAAIAAAEELVNTAAAKLEASLAAAKATIDEQGKTLAALISADATLQEGIDAAKARADQAYALAEQAGKDAAAASDAAKEAKDAAAKVAEDLKAINETLAGQINVITGNLTEVKKSVEENLTKIEAQAKSLDELKKSNEEALAKLSAQDDELKKLIEENQGKISALEASVQAALAKAEQALTDAKAYTDTKVAEVVGQITAANGLAEEAKTIASNAAAAADRAQQTADAAQKAAEAAQAAAAGAATKEEAKAAQDAANAAKQTADNAQSTANEAKTAAATAQSAAEAAATAAQNAQQTANEAKAAAEAAKTSVGTLETNYKAADTKLQEQIDALETLVSDIHGYLVDIDYRMSVINGHLSSLFENVNSLITSIILQDEQEYNVYAKVIGDKIYNSDRTKTYFPSETNRKAYLEVGKYNMQEYAGEIYATVNPAEVDVTKIPVDSLKLLNSLNEKNAYYKISKAERASGHLITRAAEKNANGLWKFSVVSTNTQIDKDPANWENKDAAFALSTSYKQAGLNEKGEVVMLVKHVYSRYGIVKNPVEATVVNTTAMTFRGVSNTVSSTTADVQFTQLGSKETPMQLALGTSEGRVYKKYIECTNITNSNGTALNATEVKSFNEENAEFFGKVLDANNYGKEDIVNVICPKKFQNYTITMDYYIWNYNGKVEKITRDVVFNEALWEAQSTSVTDALSGSAVKNGVACNDFAKWDFVTGTKSANGTTWSQEAKSYKAVFKGSNKPADGAITLSMNKNDGTMVKNISLQTTGITSLGLSEAQLKEIKKLSLNYNPASIEPDKKYEMEVTFYDQNSYIVNVMTVEFTMHLPKVGPKAEDFRVAASFNGDLVTIWAGIDATKTNATGNFLSVFTGLTTGYETYGSYQFNDRDTYGPKNVDPVYRPTAMPAMSDYDMTVGLKAVQDEHKYNLSASIHYFGLFNSYDFSHCGWADNFNVMFLSPVKYAIVGTKNNDYFVNGTVDPVMIKNTPIKYGQSFTLSNDVVTSTNPKNQQKMNFFGTDRSADIANVSVEILKSEGNAQEYIVDKNPAVDNNKNFTIQTKNPNDPSAPSMQDVAKVNVRINVTDVWGITTPINFVLEVQPNN